jgi:hypothetical protein
MLLAMTLMCAAAFAQDVSGKWTFTVQTDAGSGTFGTAPLAGTVKGNVIEFSFETTVADQKGKVVYTGKIEADGKMKGDVDYAGLGKGTWTGAKQ